MPFTFCHPAAVLVLNYLPKKWISLTGLIVGSISPDFEYFIRMQKLSLYSHSLQGLIFFNIPAGVLLTFLYHGVIHKVLINNLPAAVKGRVFQYANINWNERFKKHWPVIIVSILIGSLSHLFWDNFILRGLDYMNNTLFMKGNISYYTFWSINSFIGVVIIAFAIYQIPADNNVKANKSALLFWTIAGCTALFFFFLRALVGEYLLIRDYIVTSVTATIMGLLLTSLLFKFKLKH